ncbi:FAD-dependent oxidoreductase [Cytophagales bacterium WSM2-2]|nr:FAD-dependent oxidoreductase [Cytophagales bacterium WSM2-2]
MPIEKSVDHIVVGQGLAGSCLALQLIKRKKKIIVFDIPENNKASAVAAGLFNPITGKRLTRSWKADILFRYLFEFYKEAEVLLRSNFFHPMPIYRPFISVEEQNEWMSLSATDGIKEFIEKVFTQSHFNKVHDPHGGIMTTQSGFLNVNSFMAAVHAFLENTDSISTKVFDLARLNFSDEMVGYENIRASSIIFCEGLGVSKNPFFSWLPIRALKGETLTISLEEKPEVIFNRGVYLVPTQSDNLYTVGATYQPNDLKEDVSGGAKTELEEKLKALVKSSYKIHHQNWGMRPTTPDRRPVLGSHPIHKNILIFNGLGTKGVSLAPYFSQGLCEWIEHKSEIQSEVNIQRFKALYSNLSQ